MNDNISDEEKYAKVPTLNAKCGVALWGVEGAAYMAKMSPNAEGDNSTRSVELEAEGASLAGRYPSLDAGLLAAAYVVSYETDRDVLKLAKDVLIQFGRKDLKRVTKGEPAEVWKRAQPFANETFP